MSNETTRYAIVKGNNITGKQVAAYLPGNYEVLASFTDKVYIKGDDSMGWTLEDYVIPRLASGCLFAEELPRSKFIEHAQGMVRLYTVRLAINRDDCAMSTTYFNVRAVDKDDAALRAAGRAEQETGQVGWILDGPVEDCQ